MFSEEYGEPYFDPEHGLAEAREVFLGGNNLPAAWLATQSRYFTILELGFGAALNFLVTLECWQRTTMLSSQTFKDYKGDNQLFGEQTHLHYIAIEKNPLSIAEIENALGKWHTELAPQIALLKECYIDRPQESLSFDFDCGVKLQFKVMDVRDYTTENETSQPDAVYLDGFSPAKNPEMWSQELIATFPKRLTIFPPEYCPPPLDPPTTIAAKVYDRKLVRPVLSKANFKVKQGTTKAGRAFTFGEGAYYTNSM